MSTVRRREVAERITRGARVRRHLGELRVRRREERAGDARGQDRAARGAAARRPVIDASRSRPTRCRSARRITVEHAAGRQGDVQARRLRRGRSARGPALERVADRPRAASGARRARRSTSPRRGGTIKVKIVVDQGAVARRDRTTALPHRFAGPHARSPTSAPRTRSSRPGAESGASYRLAGRVMARRGQGKAGVPRSRGPLGPHAAAGRGRRARRGAFERVPASTLGDIVGVEGEAIAHAAAASCRCGSTGFELLAPNRQPLPDKLPRPGRRRGALPPALPRPADERPRARELFALRARAISALRRFLDDARLHRGRDAGAAAALRRRAARGRSRRTTTSSTATSTCASPPSCT